MSAETFEHHNKKHPLHENSDDCPSEQDREEKEDAKSLNSTDDSDGGEPTPGH